MKILQNIPEDIQLEKELYEWEVTAYNKGVGSWGRILFQAIILLIIAGVEAMAIYRLGDIWAAPYKYNLWFYGVLYPFQAWVCFVVVKEILEDLKESWEAQNKVLQLTLKNEGFMLSIRDKTTQKVQEQWYEAKQLQEVFYNRGPQQKAVVLKSSLMHLPQEIFIRPKDKSPEAWGRFLKAEQTKFLTLLLRTLYLHQKVQQEIPLAPPIVEEGDDFEDLSQHLIE